MPLSVVQFACNRSRLDGFCAGSLGCLRFQTPHPLDLQLNLPFRVGSIWSNCKARNGHPTRCAQVIEHEARYRQSAKLETTKLPCSELQRVP